MVPNRTQVDGPWPCTRGRKRVPASEAQRGDGAERKVRRTILLAVPPVEHTTQGGGAARSGKEWICKAVSGVVLRTLATRGRKRVPASEAQRGGWSGAEGPKDNTAYGSPSTHKPTTHKPTIPNQQPTTPNQPPHQLAATINKPPSPPQKNTMKKRMTYKSTGLSAGLRKDSCN